jgi:hypothetical protein
MNFVEVKGGRKTQRKYAESMVDFCIDMLGLGKIRTLDITVHFTNKTGDSEGLCCRVDDREYEIEINKNLKLRTMLETIAHEMVHVKQYVRHELKEPTVWKGTNVDTDKVEYWDLPWEIEAHGREVGLFVRWAQKEGVWGKSWTYV